MRKGAIFFIGMVLILISPIVILYNLAISEQPIVSSFVHLTNVDIQKAKEIIALQISQDNQAPKTLELNERDLNIVANHLLNRHIESATEIQLKPGNSTISASIDLSDYIPDRYLNIVFKLIDEHNRLQVMNLSIGDINISNHYAEKLIDYLFNQTQLNNYYRLARQHIHSIKLAEKALILTYQVDQAALNKAKQLVSFPANPKTLLVYQHLLAETIKNHPEGWLLSLSNLLQPLFELAYQRSSQDTAIDENRHVIFVVSSYINKNQWQSYLPNPQNQALEAPELLVYAYKRIDLAQHFIASAALTSLGSSYLANLMGFKKEIKDSAQGGSGFSFIDLAADRAGMYFGKMATSSSKNARKMQQVMATTKDYKDFFPEIRDLPDQIGQNDLIEHYQSVESPAAQAMLKEIDKRVKASPIYKSF